jgi:putative NADPH-quinone reductase
MQALVVLAALSPGSFTHAIAHAAAGALAELGYSVAYHDLQQEGFDPVVHPGESERNAALDPVLQGHCQDLAEADGIVVIHPNWWSQPPAILKGWVDRVFRTGLAYRFRDIGGGRGAAEGLLKAQVALVFNTSNTPEEVERERFGDPLETIWKNCVFGLCGVEHFYRRSFGTMVTSTPEQREAWLREVRETVLQHFAEVHAVSG